MITYKTAAILASVAALLLLLWLGLPYRNHSITSEGAIRVRSEYSDYLHASTSDDSMVWEYGTGDVFGYALSTGKQVPVSVGEPFAQQFPDVSGVTVVYENLNDERQELPSDVVVKNLKTGATRKFPTGSSGHVFPKVAGQWLAWNEGDKLVLADLESGATKELASFQPDSRITVHQAEISEDYLVWSEVAYFDARYSPRRTSYIKTYNLRRGAVTTLLEFEAPGGNGPRPEYALDGHRLALNEPMNPGSPRVMDIDTGETIPVAWDYRPSRSFEAPVLKGDVLVWSAYDSDSQGLNVWGVNLKVGGKPVLLVSGHGDQVAVGIVGDRLVWLSRGMDTAHAGIGLALVESLFATASDRQKDLDSQRPNP